MQVPVRIDRQWKVFLATLLCAIACFGAVYSMLKSSPPELVRPSAIDNDHLLSLYSTTKDIQCTATTSTGHTRILTANSDTTDYEGATYYYVGKIDNYEHYVACTNDEPLLTMVYSLQNRIVIYSITSATVLAVFVIFEVSNFMNKRIDKKRAAMGLPPEF